LVMICRSGNRSSQAARALSQAGFTNVHNLVGGMLRVREKGV
jgi:rhodanese-related sulfurtransferase